MTPQTKRAAAGSSRLKTFYLVLAVVAVAGAAALVYALTQQGGGAAIAPVELPDAADPRALYEQATPVVIGNDAAPVKLVVFSDFQCPACKTFTTQIEPRLRAAYADSGKLQIVYYDFPLVEIHRHAFLAARAARCAGEQGKFWEYHDLLFGRQEEWAQQSGVTDDFREYAQQLGLDRAQFQGCLESDRFADVVTANRRLGEQLQVSGTPTVIVNNRPVRNALNYGEVKDVVDGELTS